MAKIIVDLDGTLVDPHTKIINYLNMRFPESDFGLYDIDSYDFRECFSEKVADALFSYYNSDGFYARGVTPFQGAIEAVNKLSEMGNDIVLVSHPMDGHIQSKNRYIQHRLIDNGLDVDAYFLGEKREYIGGDILIDDKPDHIRNFSGVGILHNRPYNIDSEFSEVVCRFNHWKKVPRLVEGMFRNSISV